MKTYEQYLEAVQSTDKHLSGRTKDVREFWEKKLNLKDEIFEVIDIREMGVRVNISLDKNDNSEPSSYIMMDYQNDSEGNTRPFKGFRIGIKKDGVIWPKWEKSINDVNDAARKIKKMMKESSFSSAKK